MVRKSLRTIGGSWGVIIPKIYLEELGINPLLHDVNLEIIDGALKITKTDKVDVKK